MINLQQGLTPTVTGHTLTSTRARRIKKSIRNGRWSEWPDQAWGPTEVGLPQDKNWFERLGNPSARVVSRCDLCPHGEKCKNDTCGLIHMTYPKTPTKACKDNHCSFHHISSTKVVDAESQLSLGWDIADVGKPFMLGFDTPVPLLGNFSVQYFGNNWKMEPLLEVDKQTSGDDMESLPLD